MGRVKINIKHRLSASSLLEVIVSMVIIVVVFGLAMMIITNITRGTLSVKKKHAYAILKNVLSNDEKQNEWVDKTINIDSVSVEQRIKAYTTAGLLEVHLTAYDVNNEKVAELQKVIIADNE